MAGGSLNRDRCQPPKRRPALHGRHDGKDYRVLHMPFMARLLSLASFETVGSLLNGTHPLHHAESRFLPEAVAARGAARRAYGDHRVNADGWFDLKAEPLSLEGTLVPPIRSNAFRRGASWATSLLGGRAGRVGRQCPRHRLARRATGLGLIPERARPGLRAEAVLFGRARPLVPPDTPDSTPPAR